MTRRILISGYFLLLTIYSFGQLQANFTIDKASGCSPLDVKFTNTTSGASGSVKYTWDFGNGNSSDLANPGATYTDERSYTVTLTAANGGIKSTISKTITVYKKPTVAFSASPTIGCVPLTVRLNSTSTAGDGTISNYLWDFGDGKTQSDKSLQSITNTYTVPQKPPVSLTITNSFGCTGTLSQPDLITVLKGLVASFTASATQLCSVGDAINFTNTSTGDGALTYNWDFGDGIHSSDFSPSHVYGKRGSYIVRMIVTNDAGCSATAKNVTINVGNFNVDFVVPAKLCAGQAAYFSNKSTRPYDSIRWRVNGAVVPFDAYGNLNYKFAAQGTYKVTLTAYYQGCKPSVAKDVVVGNLPPLKGFISDNSGVCNLPITFSFKDTTSDAVKWEWRYNNNTVLFDSNRTAARSYPDSGTDKIGLVVVNKYGCTAGTTKVINFYSPQLAIVIRKSSSPAQSPNRGCPGLNVTFSTTPLNEIVKFKWDLGDGTTSTKAEPSYIYNKLGSYSVKLNYETKNGCRGVLSFDSIFVNQVTRSDFHVIPDTVICGNTEANLIPDNPQPNLDYVWYVNNVEVGYQLSGDVFKYHFEKEGYYTVKLVVRSGNCRDSVTKVNYIHILPAFPTISQVMNTCSGTRGLVTFTDSSRSSNRWHWDFGDGAVSDYTSFRNNITHEYTATGAYLVKLTVTNGPCIVTDSVVTNVLLKQNPKLAADVTKICSSDTANITVSGFEINPLADSVSGYNIAVIQFDDLTTSKATLQPGTWTTSFTTPLKGIETDKENLRVIMQSKGMNCYDTTNFIPLKTGGPIGAFKFSNIKCYRQQVVFTDASTPSKRSPIISWEWKPGDDSSFSFTSNKALTYHYREPGTYYPQLKLTDQSGCDYLTPVDSANPIIISGPVASFTASDTNVLINTTVNFRNTSTFTEDSEFFWRFPNNALITEDNPSFEFQQEGRFTVLLIERNIITGCSDTARKTIIVKRVQSIFDYELTYSGQNNCPPLLAVFKSNSINAVKLKWSFGDGGEAENDETVSHVYTSAGNFVVTLYSIDAFGRMDSSEQVIEVKGPSAVLHADSLYGCSSLPVRLSADTSNTASFRWDFGDGTIINGTDTFATHTYTTPGMYSPALILTDVNGCTSTSASDATIVLDDLSVSIEADRDSIVCDSSVVRFNSMVNSVSQSQFNSKLDYRWSSSLQPSEVFNGTTALYYFNRYGVHDVTLTVKSAFGCSVQQVFKVDIRQGVQAAISGPAAICVYDSVSLKGNSIPAIDSLRWNWDLGNGQLSELQNPLPVKYSSDGIKDVKLVVVNGSCTDTANYTLEVRNRPAITIAKPRDFVCLGDSLTMQVTGGNTISWTPAVDLTTNGGFISTVIPKDNTTYTAVIADDIGCTNADSIAITVVKPFKIQTEKTVLACAGVRVQLAASGAATYYWTGSNGFSSSAAKPFIIPESSGSIVVKGFDKYKCFSDSAIITVDVGPRPTVELGPDKRVIANQEFILTGTTSADVNSWTWWPATYLQCSDCQAPVCKPLSDIMYKLTVANEYGCTATDSLFIQMICGKELVYIPSGFTPNGDGLNDRFAINGSGVFIRHFTIFDRWGKMVFERANLNPGDRNSSWDGNSNGQPLPAGAYVYFLEVICNTGEPFSFKGTVTLIR